MKIVRKYGATFESIPPQRNNKNVLEFKNGIYWSIYPQLSETYPELDDRILVTQSTVILNNLYSSDIMTTYELAHGFSKPMISKPACLPNDIVIAQQHLEANHKLTHISRTEYPFKPSILTGDLDEVYIRKAVEKRGTWSATRTLIDYDIKCGTVVMP